MTDQVQPQEKTIHKMIHKLIGVNNHNLIVYILG